MKYEVDVSDLKKQQTNNTKVERKLLFNIKNRARFLKTSISANRGLNCLPYFPDYNLRVIC